ncbi:MAG: ATP-dependent DNA helicase [Candidatus Aenigmatarchaeota archaeon]
MFPHEKIRPGQEELMKDTKEILEKEKNLMVHAPTGIGKTSGVLTPALEYAMENNKVVFFLTSRHSQHVLAIDTLKKMYENSDKAFVGSNLIGKKWMCPREELNDLPSSDFYNYCEKLKEKKECPNYNKTIKGKMKLTKKAKKKIDSLLSGPPLHTEEVKSKCSRFCPYEISLNLLSNSDVVVCDYYHIFSSVGTNLLNRLDIDLEDIIVVVDEAHNLPSRLRNLLSHRLSSYTLGNAIKEAKEFEFDEIAGDLRDVLDSLEELAKSVDGECKMPKKGFINKMKKIGEYDEMTQDFIAAGDVALEEKRRSFMDSVGQFLDSWKGESEGFTRILSKEENDGKTFITLDYKCMDPSIVSENTIKNSHSTILMSGTMKPMEMYEDLLGMKKGETEKKEYESHFPEENRLNLVYPEVTTKYRDRSREEFKRIAKSIQKVADKIPGNSIVFFPSYGLLKRVGSMVDTKKEIIREDRNFDKAERKRVLEELKKTNNKSLFAVMGGSFYEGIDLPGKALEGIVVIGVPLARPDLERKSLIEYYDKKFGNGWDYAYIYPALVKVAQACGRLIRSEEDEGVVVLMDKRYTWSKYGTLFSGWNAKLTRQPEKDIEEFFM